MTHSTMTKPATQPVIMQIIPALGAGGAEQSCIDVAAALVQAKAKAIIISNGGARVPELQRFGAMHIDMPVHSKNPLVMYRNMRKIMRLIREHNVDIVHARSRAPAWSAYYACKKAGTHFMTTCHAPYNINGDLKRFYNSSITHGERVIANSKMAANYLLKNYQIDESKIRIIPRGIAIEKFHPTAVTAERLIKLSSEWRIPDGANVIMMPGRITRWKGHLVLIEAMRILNRRDLFCLMIGDDQGRSEYREELENDIQQKNLSGRVRIVSHCNDMPAAYMLATIVVSASTDPEGFGRVAVEGQAMGRMTIATDHGGSQETIINGETGWLVKPGDAQALADAIEHAMTMTPQQRAMLATRSMAHIATNFTREQMTDKTLDVYAELLRGSQQKNHDAIKNARTAKHTPDVNFSAAAE